MEPFEKLPEGRISPQLANTRSRCPPRARATQRRLPGRLLLRRPTKPESSMELSSRPTKFADGPPFSRRRFGIARQRAAQDQRGGGGSARGHRSRSTHGSLGSSSARRARREGAAAGAISPPQPRGAPVRGAGEQVPPRHGDPGEAGETAEAAGEAAGVRGVSGSGRGDGRWRRHRRRRLGFDQRGTPLKQKKHSLAPPPAHAPGPCAAAGAREEPER